MTAASSAGVLKRQAEGMGNSGKITAGFAAGSLAARRGGTLPTKVYQVATAGGTAIPNQRQQRGPGCGQAASEKANENPLSVRSSPLPPLPVYREDGDSRGRSGQKRAWLRFRKVNRTQSPAYSCRQWCRLSPRGFSCSVAFSSRSSPLSLSRRPLVASRASRWLLGFSLRRVSRWFSSFKRRALSSSGRRRGVSRCGLFALAVRFVRWCGWWWVRRPGRVISLVSRGRPATAWFSRWLVRVSSGLARFAGLSAGLAAGSGRWWRPAFGPVAFSADTDGEQQRRTATANGERRTATANSNGEQQRQLQVCVKPRRPGHVTGRRQRAW